MIIPTRDRAATVIRAVSSALAGTGPEVEVVVVDDGSRDDTQARLAAVHDPRLIVVVQSVSGGANHARNLGAAKARAPLLAFLDSDDSFLPGRTSRLIDLFAGEPFIDATIDGYVDHGNRRIDTHRPPTVMPDRARLRHMLIAHQIPLTNSALTVRRTAFEAVGGFDEQLYRHQDRDLLIRLGVGHHIRFGAAVDVEKFRGTASISHDFKGYIAGLDALAARLPEAKQAEYRDLFHYLAVRGVLKALVQGRIFAAIGESRRLAKAEHLPGGIWAGLARYRKGKRLRTGGPRIL